MLRIDNDPDFREVSVWRELVIILLFVMLGYVLQSFVNGIFVVGVLDLDEEGLNQLMTGKLAAGPYFYALQCMQLIGTAGLFLIPAVSYIELYRKQNLRDYFRDNIQPNYRYVLLGLLPLIVYASMPLNGQLYLWNQNLHLPEWLSGLQNWIEQEEAGRTELTVGLTKFENWSQLILGLLVIAILPGLAEEFIFRGLFQRLLIRKGYNVHLVIWGVAALFSAIHFQFLGFVPRMMLGAIFGYIYLWSGSLTYPAVAHVLNNGITLLLMHYLRINTTEGTPDYSELDQFPWPTLLLFTAGFGYLLFRFRKICLTYQVEQEPLADQRENDTV